MIILDNRKYLGGSFMKKLLSVILAICILTLGVAPCFAVEDKCDCGEAPIIYVAALGSGSVYLDAGTENERILFRPEISDILSDFAPLLPAAGQLLLEKNYDAFGDVLIDCVNKSFGMLALDNEGKSHERVTSEEFHPEAEPVHSLDHNYYFGYDFRLDPVENAQKLRVYVEEVKGLSTIIRIISTVPIPSSSLNKSLKPFISFPP
jgi:hypothetical protein